MPRDPDYRGTNERAFNSPLSAFRHPPRSQACKGETTFGDQVFSQGAIRLLFAKFRELILCRLSCAFGGSSMKVRKSNASVPPPAMCISSSTGFTFEGPFRRDFALFVVRVRVGQTLVNLFYDASPRAEEPLLCGRRRRRTALINNFSRGPCRSGDDNPAEIRRSRAFGEASLYWRSAHLHASEALSRMYTLASAMHS